MSVWYLVFSAASCAHLLAIVEYMVCKSLHFAGAILAHVETEKRMSLIKAWEENEKAKAENK